MSTPVRKPIWQELPSNDITHTSYSNTKKNAVSLQDAATQIHVFESVHYQDISLDLQNFTHLQSHSCIVKKKAF